MRGYWAVAEQIYRGASGSLISGLCAATASGLILLIWDNPWASMLVGVAICVSSAGIYLMQRPLKALYLAIFLSLLPQGLRIEPIYTVVSNLAVAIALLAWVGQWLLRRERIHWNATWLLVGAYIIFGLISLLWAPDLGRELIKDLSFAAS